MSAGELVIVLAAVLCALGFAALIVVLVRVLDTLRALRGEVASLRAETTPLLEELRSSTDEAREAVNAARTDLDRFDRVLGSAEAISGAMSGSGRVARTAFSAPVIKAAGVATGTSRALRRLRSTAPSADLVQVTEPRRGRRRA
jgi:Sec-independent protein translocase protein TatA